MILSLLLALNIQFAQASFIPENDIRIPVNSSRSNGMKENDFNEVINQFESHYSPIIAGKGKNLVIERLWTDSRLNAEAVQENENWIIKMYGGFARYRTMDKDGLMLVICHEMGHHLGGAPRFTSILPWSSVEGQSDYFAATKCLRHVWNNDNNTAIIAPLKIPEALQKICSDNWNQTSDQALCIRIGMASLNVTCILAFIARKPAPKVDKPVLTGVAKTKQTHNSAQCRLDTLIQGSICSESYLTEFSKDSEVTGSCHRTTGHTVGLRPRCWFKPSITN